jgi:hypothetical protein
VALMVERIKSTKTYAQIGARVGITANRAHELVERGIRMVAHGNAECSLSKDDLKQRGCAPACRHGTSACSSASCSARPKLAGKSTRHEGRRHPS